MIKKYKKPRKKKLSPKAVEGRIDILKVTKYKGISIYLRRIDNDIFEYLVPHKGEIYSDYLIITPRKGDVKLSKEEVIHVMGLILAGATTTIDITIKKQKVKESDRQLVETFEKVGQNAFNNNNAT